MGKGVDLLIYVPKNLLNHKAQTIRVDYMNHNLSRKTATTTVLIILRDHFITGNPIKT